LIKLHPLFLLLLVLSIATGYWKTFCLMFALVLLHEGGHWLAARYCGWEVKEIRLLPFGGELLAESRRSSSSVEEVFVALAGPAVNGCLIVGFMVCKAAGMPGDSIWDYLIQANAALALFNLLPILPLDGGKVLQALLSRYVCYARALRWSIHISLVGGLSLLIWSLRAHNMSGIQFEWLLVSLFLLSSNLIALRQHPYQWIRFLLQRRHAWDAGQWTRNDARSHIVSVSHGETPAGALERLVRERLNYFHITDERRSVLAIVDEQRMLAAYFAQRR
jgi:stage IV sporulation protein FB